MTKTNRERIDAILHYKSYDRIPIMHFGFWDETLDKWQREGHLTVDEVKSVKKNFDGDIGEYNVAQKIGFDDNILNYTGQRGAWYDAPLYPVFEEEVISANPDGSYVQLNVDGVHVLIKEGFHSVFAEVGHTVVDRESWEKYYLPKLQWTPERLDMDQINDLILTNDTRERYTGVYCGSLYGKLRNYWGLINVSFLQVDDPDLHTECVDAIAEISYQTVKHTLETGVKVDYGHFWEDICYNHGPLINPKLFREITGKHYRRIVDECNKYGIDIITLDCDGLIDDLIPTWLENGVNTMFPVEYGAWEYSFDTMRKEFGKELRGFGNVNKNILYTDRKTIDKEIERIRKLVDLGGFIPCLDHRIAPDAEWDLTKYYCERMKEVFWK